MHPIRLMAAILLLGVASCGTTQGDMTLAAAPQIDQPSAPFPYNSRFCP